MDLQINRIFVVEDHAIFRRGLVDTLESEEHLQVCGESDNWEEALAAIEELKPDLALVDLNLKVAQGLDLIKTLKKGDREIRVLVLSMHNEDVYAPRVLQAGASGYLMKKVDPHKLLEAVETVLDNRVYVSEKLNQKLLSNFMEPEEGTLVSPLEKLTDRELEVFTLIGEGLSSRKIAEKLLIKVKTVYSHRSRIVDKLKVQGAAELFHQARLFKEEGLL